MSDLLNRCLLKPTAEVTILVCHARQIGQLKQWEQGHLGRQLRRIGVGKWSNGTTACDVSSRLDSPFSDGEWNALLLSKSARGDAGPSRPLFISSNGVRNKNDLLETFNAWPDWLKKDLQLEDPRAIPWIDTIGRNPPSFDF